LKPNQEARVDLHTHTTASDGLLSPHALVQLAAERGLVAIAITDHDSVAGVAEAHAAGKACGVEVVPGVELSASGRNSEIHVLGFFVDPESCSFQEALAQLRRMRFQRAEAMVARLNKLGVALRMEQVVALAGDTAIGRPHVAQALVAGGLAPSFPEAFARYLKRNGPAWVAKQNFAAAEALAVIHRAGGVAVVAHPTHGPSPSELRAMVAAGLDGIEVRHPLLSASDTDRFTRLAETYKLVRSGGSDYHGVGRSHCDLGSLNVTANLLEALRARRPATAGCL